LSIRKWEVFCIANAKVRNETIEAKSLGSTNYCAFSQVYATQNGAGFSESLVICTKPNTNLKHSFASRRCKAGKFWDVGLQLISLLYVCVESCCIKRAEIQLFPT
jgi:hypothetical protein